MDIRAGVFIISINQGLLVYKVDNPVQSSLLSSLILTLIQGFSLWLVLRSLSCNIQVLGVTSDLDLTVSSCHWLYKHAFIMPILLSSPHLTTGHY